MLIRVQLNPNEPEEMCDEGTLLQWAQDGRLIASHKVWSSSNNTWVLAKDYPLLTNFFSQALWDAWEVEDDWDLDPNIETGIRKRLQNIQKPVPPADETHSRKKKVQSLPTSAITPLEDVAQSKEQPFSKQSKPQNLSSSLENRSRTSAIPTYSPQPKKTLIELERAQSWQPDIRLQDQPQLWLKEDNRSSSSSFSFFRLGILIVPMILILGAWRWYIVSVASATFPLEVEADKELTLQTKSEKKEEMLFLLEDELKGMLRPRAQSVTRSKSLEDALRIDLEYVNLDIHSIDARVLSWTGNSRDIPKEAKIHIAIHSNGELEREIPLVAMIVAKYTIRYFSTMEMFTVELYFADEANKFHKDIKVSTAQNLLLNPGSLTEFLSLF